MSSVDTLTAYVDSLLEDVAAAPATVPFAPACKPQQRVEPVHGDVSVGNRLRPDPPLPTAQEFALAAARTQSPDIAALFAPRAAPIVEVVDKPVRWLSFRVGGQSYALEVLKVQEVLRVPDIAPVTGADADTLGVMNLRGQIVQVINLRTRLAVENQNLPLAPAHEARVMVLEVDGQVLGVLVDAVAEVFAAAGGALMGTGLLPGAVPIDWFRGMLRRNGELVAALDASRLLEV